MYIYTTHCIQLLCVMLGIIIPCCFLLFSGGALPFNEGFISNATVQFTLPEDLYACDIAVFTVWCRLASVQFSVLEIPQNIFVSGWLVVSVCLVCGLHFVSIAYVCVSGLMCCMCQPIARSYHIMYVHACRIVLCVFFFSP